MILKRYDYYRRRATLRTACQCIVGTVLRVFCFLIFFVLSSQVPFGKRENMITTERRASETQRPTGFGGINNIFNVLRIHANTKYIIYCYITYTFIRLIRTAGTPNVRTVFTAAAAVGMGAPRARFREGAAKDPEGFSGFDPLSSSAQSTFLPVTGRCRNGLTPREGTR